MSLPHFPFFASDWLAGTIDMSAEERGAYIQLLALSWDRDGLPACPRRLAAMAGVAEVPAAVLEKIPVSEDGKRRNPKLERVRAEAIRLHSTKVEQGRRGGLAKAKKLAELKPSSSEGSSEGSSESLAELKPGYNSASVSLVANAKRNPSNHNHNHILPSEVHPSGVASAREGRTLAEIVEELAPGIGMDSKTQTEFLAYWMSANAEGTPLWLAQGMKGWSPAARMRSWMARAESGHGKGFERPGKAQIRETDEERRKRLNDINNRGAPT